MATPNIIDPQFAEMETRVEAMIDIQTEIFATLAQINRGWLYCAKTEARVLRNCPRRSSDR
jgi:hypothetical protein